MDFIYVVNCLKNGRSMDETMVYLNQVNSVLTRANVQRLWDEMYDEFYPF